MAYYGISLALDLQYGVSKVSFGTMVGGTNSAKIVCGGTLNEVAGLEMCTGTDQPLRGVRLTRVHLFR